jgi:hypothetical protein
VGEDAAELGAGALAADLRGLVGHCADGGEGGGIESEVERGGETHGAEHAELVVSEALIRIADGSHEFRIQIGHAADIVDDLF